MFIDPDTSAETPVKFRFEYNSSENAFGFRNEQNMFVSFNQGSSIDISDTTATSGTVLSGYVFYNSNEERTIGSYVPLDTSDATAKAKNIESGYTAYVNGVKITGTVTGIVHALSKVNQGIVADLTKARTNLAAAGNDKYAIFAGGSDFNSNPLNTVEAYNTSFSKSSTSLSISLSYLAGTNIGDYIIFGGGFNSGVSDAGYRVDAYNSSLSRSNPDPLNTRRSHLAATNIGDYALFGGGRTYTGDPAAATDAYNTSLTHSNPTGLYETQQNPAATNIGDYALFGGGATLYSPRISSIVNAYDTSLTRSIPTRLSDARAGLSATNNNTYALFGGGNNGSPVDTVDVYSRSLTRSTATSLYNTTTTLAAASTGDYAIFGGGCYAYNSIRNGVAAYNSSLSKSTPTALSTARYWLTATSIGNYVIFGGGTISSAVTNVIDAYVST